MGVTILGTGTRKVDREIGCIVYVGVSESGRDGIDNRVVKHSVVNNFGRMGNSDWSGGFSFG